MSELNLFLAARDLLLVNRTDYEVAYREFTWPKLERFNWAHDYFDRFAQGNSQRALWLVQDDSSEHVLSFEALSRRSNCAANFLREHGVQRGDVVLMMLGNVIPLWETMLAAIKLGAVLIPATNLLTASDLQDRIERGNVRFVITEHTEAGKFEGISNLTMRFVTGADRAGWIRFEESAAYPNEFDDVARDVHAPFLRYFTSGTTSKPKLVEHSQQSYPVGHLSTMYWLGLRPDDVHWNISSTGWAKHAYTLFAPWNAGACSFVLNQARFDARRILRTLCERPITAFCAPPTVWRMLIQEDLAAYAPGSLRELGAAGEPLNPEVIECVHRAWGLTVRDGYGQTETTAQLGNTPQQSVKPGSVGRPLPGYKITLLDPSGAEANQGEIAVSLEQRPIGVLTAYTGDLAKTQEALGQAHYRTGDIAERDADGYFTFIGRADDIFKSSDYRISPFELESALLEHPDVVEAAVVPSPDAARWSVPKAFISARAGAVVSDALAQSILQHARARLAPYQRIRRVEFAELPKTVSGKIRRVELRAFESERDLSIRRPHEWWEEDFTKAE
jgi:acetyl-CoA synthetase